jgi:rhodanese-related sulfurtransferase
MTNISLSNIIIFGVFAIFLLIQSGFADRLRTESISPDQVKTVLTEGSGVLIDVREKDEVALGIIEGAVWIPLSKLQADSDQNTLSKLDQKKTLMIYCRSGTRSAKAATLFSKKGFKVRNAGGFSTLSAAGLKTGKINPESGP